ncbi:hypothetical protein [Streptomyces sp. NPDC051561]|uniref:hypothetical protein n=1 Tax=Streptomyces sp. NPDC051561 TaxID=3365658 RepID=UPI0037A91040
MRIYRTVPTRSFTIFQNALLQDHTISWCASGVLQYLVSLPEAASASVRSLAGKRKEGRARIASALRELEEARYLKRVTSNDAATGQIRTVYEVFDHRYDEVVGTGEPEGGRKPAPGDPASGAPGRKPSVSSTPVKEPPTARVECKVPPPRKAPPATAVKADAELPEERADERHGRAARFLHTLGKDAPALSLGISESLKLAPLVVACWDKGVGEAALRKSLTAALPDEVLSAPKLLANRLTRKAAGKDAAVPVRRSEPRLPAACEVCGAKLPRPGRCKGCAGEAMRWGDVLQLGTLGGLPA